jgi:hypothetical protein
MEGLTQSQNSGKETIRVHKQLERLEDHQLLQEDWFLNNKVLVTTLNFQNVCPDGFCRVEIL